MKMAWLLPMVAVALAGCSGGGQQAAPASPGSCFLYIYGAPLRDAFDSIAISSGGAPLGQFNSPPGPPIYENRVTFPGGKSSLHFEMTKDGKVVYKTDIAMDVQPGGLYSANFAAWPASSKTSPLKILSPETPGLPDLACWIGPATNRMKDRFKVILKPGQDPEAFKKKAADRGYKVVGDWPYESSLALAPHPGQTLVDGVVECEKWEEVRTAYIEAHPVD